MIAINVVFLKIQHQQNNFWLINDAIHQPLNIII